MEETTTEAVAMGDPLNEAALIVAAEYTGRDKGYSFDPTILAMIVSVFLPLIERCLPNNSPEKVVAAMKRPSFWQSRDLMEECCRNTSNVFAAARLHRACLKAAKNADSTLLLACCNAVAQKDDAL